MDPLSQFILGAAVAGAAQPLEEEKLPKTLLIGGLAGLAPDLDVLIQSSVDPLLKLEFHRHFTHSLAFVPLGAAFVALILYRFFKNERSFKALYISCFLGYLSHAPLDACTSYGTQLLWPFSNFRVSWDSISIIDPLFTLPLVAAALYGGLKKKRKIVLAGLLYSLFYLVVGVAQRERAESFAEETLRSQNTTPHRLSAKPSFGNLILWKVIYESQGQYHVDAVRVGWRNSFIKGESIPILNIKRDLPWLQPGSVQANDIERFRWFSGNFLAMDPRRENYIIDMRYSVLPHRIEALWGIQLDPQKPNQHVEYRTHRDTRKEKRKEFFRLLFGG